MPPGDNSVPLPGIDNHGTLRWSPGPPARPGGRRRVGGVIAPGRGRLGTAVDNSGTGDHYLEPANLHEKSAGDDRRWLTMVLS